METTRRAVRQGAGARGTYDSVHSDGAISDKVDSAWRRFRRRARQRVVHHSHSHPHSHLHTHAYLSLRLLVFSLDFTLTFGLPLLPPDRAVPLVIDRPNMWFLGLLSTSASSEQ